MRKYVAYILMFIWYYFLVYFLANKFVSDRILNALLTFLILLISSELTRRITAYTNGSDDEKFINEWEVKLRKGELNFVLFNGLKIAIAIVLMIGIYVVTNKVEVDVGGLALALFVSISMGFLLSLASWSENDKKYINLQERK